ncbi:MAG: hypothetical protein LCH93_00755 [Proteobacteria bacterium]|nr:hypothetical protein [Pseudomonadota bacterium]
MNIETLTRPGLDEAVVYRLAKALRAAEVQPSRRLADTTATNTLAVTPGGCLHAGVMRYFTEAGLDP